MLARFLLCLAFAAPLAACSSDQDGTDDSNLIDEGSTFNGVACDASIDGEAQCGDDTTMVYCSNGEWWGQDCSEQGATECVDDGTLVDCVIES